MSNLFDPEPESDWREVSQAHFLAWPEHLQLAYCASRDEDSAAHADTLWEIEWYLERARMYRAMSKELTPAKNGGTLFS